jgi:threonyl-tRNA synthetase
VRRREDVTGANQSAWEAWVSGGATAPLADLVDSDDAAVAFAARTRLGLKTNQIVSDEDVRRRLKRWAEPSREAEPGHLSWSPEGVIARNLIREWLRSVMRRDLGGEEIATATVQRWPGSALVPVSELAETFHERLYYVGAFEEEPENILRFGADIGLFGLTADRPFAESAMPVRFFECATAYRRNLGGELRFPDRGRSFEFFDHHCFCRSEVEAQEEYARLFWSQIGVLKDMGIRPIVEFTIAAQEEQFFAPIIRDAVERLGDPIFVERLSRPKHYWAGKHVCYTALGDRTFTSQLDSTESNLFGLKWRDSRQRSHPVVLCHSSPASIERWTVVFARAALDADPVGLPTWLAPTQVRLIPLRDEHISRACKLAALLREREIRADVDDRKRSLAKRVRSAGQEWIPRVAVIGDRELEGGALKVRNRDGSSDEFSAEQLVGSVSADCAGKPTHGGRMVRLSERADPW